MAGINQHYIPQALLRGFAAKRRKKTTQVYVYPKDGDPFLTGTRGTAAERYFYSELSATSPTLDDQITTYENNTLNTQLDRLRSCIHGDSIEATMASEFVAHLITRNNHIRNTFGDGINRLITNLAGLLSEMKDIKSLFRKDGAIPDNWIEPAFELMLKSEPHFAHVGVPQDVLKRMTIAMLEDNAKEIFSELSSKLSEFGKLVEVNKVVRSGHIRALESTLVPPPLVKKLCQFNWKVICTPDENFILPDCIAIANINNLGLRPLLTSEIEDIAQILIPISSKQILVGTRSEDLRLSVEAINLAAAACSYRFFISSEETLWLSEISKTIGTAASKEINSAVDEALKDFISERGSLFSETQSFPTIITANNADLPLTPIDDRSPEEKFDYQISFLDWTNEDSVTPINQAVQQIINGLNNSFSLSRLDGITFSDDYEAAVKSIDYGYKKQTEFQSINNEQGFGVGVPCYVFRDGTVKVRIVARAAIGEALVGSDKNATNWALFSLAHLLADVQAVKLFDDRLPNTFLNSVNSTYKTLICSPIFNAWKSYFSSRISAFLYPGSYTTLIESLSAALRCFNDAAVAAKKRYFIDQCLGNLVDSYSQAIRHVINATSCYVGYCDATQQSEGKTTEDVIKILDEHRLTRWFQTLSSAMRQLWSRNGQWESLDEFLMFAQIIERMFWQHGLVPYEIADGKMYLRVFESAGMIEY